jgi:hypothetical protein
VVAVVVHQVQVHKVLMELQTLAVAAVAVMVVQELMV